jgi:hypothetical protein
MAKWIYNRPLDCCDETELRIAKLLGRLPDDWIICWGFYYGTDREGDFIILGPYGGVLVLEVKGGHLRKLGATGCWDGEPSGPERIISRCTARTDVIIC